jgi:hypothetical protein
MQLSFVSQEEQLLRLLTQQLQQTKTKTHAELTQLALTGV